MLGPHSEIEHGDVQSYEVRMVQSIVTMRSLCRFTARKLNPFVFMHHFVHVPILLESLVTSIDKLKQANPSEILTWF